MQEYKLFRCRSGREWRSTLITGTNRLKTLAEITSPESILEGDWVKIAVEGVPDLESVLDRLPSGTQVSWRGARHPGIDSSTLDVDLRISSERLVKEIRTQCAELGIRLDVSR